MTDQIWIVLISTLGTIAVALITRERVRSRKTGRDLMAKVNAVAEQVHPSNGTRLAETTEDSNARLVRIEGRLTEVASDVAGIAVELVRHTGNLAAHVLPERRHEERPNAPKRRAEDRFKK